MDVVKMDIGDISMYENNPRKNDSSVKKVARSIKEFGWKQPIVVDKNNVIIVGHTRYKAAKSLKLKEVPVIIAKELTDEQVKAYRIADNRLNKDSIWDELKLHDEFEELDENNPDFDFTLLGFEGHEVDDIFGLDTDEDEEDEDDSTPNNFLEKPVTQDGDIWLLENHALMCGDATKQENVEKLLNTFDVKKVDMIFTDPPYNVNYKGGKQSPKTNKIVNDNLTTEDFIQFLVDVFKIYKEVLNENGAIYVCFPWKTYEDFKLGIEKNNFSIMNCIVWVKGNFILIKNYKNSLYNYQHEMIFYCNHKGNKANWYGDKGESDIWNFPKNAKNDLHPTMKPVKLVKKAIQNSSKLHDNILDLFGGSGSTLIACEELNRTCFMMELDVNYCDTIIRRWQTVTKKDAILAESKQKVIGARFNELLKK